MHLDSTFLIDLLNRLDAAEDKLEHLIEAETPASISPLSVYEAGIELQESERETFDEIIASMVVHPLGEAESRRALAIQ